MKGIIKHQHGLRKHRLYNVWYNIISSSYNEKNKNYKNIGAKGIKVCDRWLLIENFIEDVGDRVEGMLFARKDTTKDYGPDNWQWFNNGELRMRNLGSTLTSEESRIKRNNQYFDYLAKVYR